MKKKNINMLCIVMLLAVIMNVIFISSKDVLVTEAATNKNANVEKSFLFAVPNGGWSSARIKLFYTETYNIKNGKSVFSKRSRSVLFQRAGATELPKYSYGTLKHSNGKTFTSWKKGDLVYGSPWNTGSIYHNSTIVTYARNTSVEGTLNAIVSCNNASVPMRAVSVSQKLNTK